MLSVVLGGLRPGSLGMLDYQRDNLVGGVASLRDPAAVPILSGLVSDQSVDLRLAAVRALRDIGDRSCIIPLTRALSDSNQEVRYTAVISLADIYHLPQYHPSVTEFHRNESRYTLYFSKAGEQRHIFTQFLLCYSYVIEV